MLRNRPPRTPGESGGEPPQLLPPGPQWNLPPTTLDAPTPSPPHVMPGNRSPRNFSNLHDFWLPLSFWWRGAQSRDRLTIFIIPHRFFYVASRRLNVGNNFFVPISFSFQAGFFFVFTFLLRSAMKERPPLITGYETSWLAVDASVMVYNPKWYGKQTTEVVQDIIRLNKIVTDFTSSSLTLKTFTFFFCVHEKPNITFPEIQKWQMHASDQSQSQSHITTGMSWCQALIWDPRPIFLSSWDFLEDSYCSLCCSALSDDRTGL
jgi:hypothetical protein